MTFEEYQKEAVKFRTETANNEEYLTLGLIEEVGEAAGKLAKRRRDGVWDEKAFIKELGDILWFVANLADYLDENIDYNISETLHWGDFLTPMIVDDISYSKALAFWASSIVFDECTVLVGFREVMTHIYYLAKMSGYTLEQVAEINLAKLRDRAARGKIQGNGDER